MRILVWQWYRRGGPPRFAALLAEALGTLPGVETNLSLADNAEPLRSATPPVNDMPVKMFESKAGLALRVAATPFAVGKLARRVAAFRPDLAICTHPHMLDLVMAMALQRLGVPFVVLVNDADAHPGDGLPLQMWLQRRLCARSMAVGALSEHVGERLRQQGVAGHEARPLIRLLHPPVAYAMPSADPAPGSGLRLLSFGRLLPYKGLDLLAEALARLGPRKDLTVRIVGSGPETATLDALRALPGVTVENRWVPEEEIGHLLGWSNALVLPYREASQSGVAAAALAVGRRVLATRVGGLAEQLSGDRRAILCEPDAASLATGLKVLLDTVDGAASPVPPNTAAVAWREMAMSLLSQIEALGLLCASRNDTVSATTPRASEWQI